MTKEELCIHACRYAIRELTRKGSTGFITSSHEGGRQITWVEVMEWLNREQQPEDAISRAEAVKVGHWILTDDDFVYCSECEDSYYPRPIDASWYYCPHCGAKMIEPQENEET